VTAVGIVTQARASSTRLSGKVLVRLAGRTVLDHHLDRLERSGLPVLVATTTNDSDDPIAQLAAARGVPVFRGSEQDVLGRYAACAREHSLDVVVRVTSDCPLVDAREVLRGVDLFLAEGDDALYVSNALRRTYPRGFDFEVFSASALADADRNATEASDREHVTPYLYRRAGARTRDVLWPVDRSAYRVTLDTPDDLALLRVLMESYQAHLLDCAGIIDLLDAHPELVEVNAGVRQKSLGE
jgi:spore coat polysaccharide biosynthesis protein SpsF